MTAIDGFTGILNNFTRASTVPLSFTFKDSSGVAIDVTGYKLYLALSKTKGAVVPDLEITMVPSEPASGVISGEVTDTQTAALAAGRYYYSLKYIKPDGRAYTFDQGRIKVNEAINPRVAQ